ncbi:MAG: hypothetical protein H6739_09895 [Alphaproteobacteria bacterium]|nr:hypothetical protein [Alphaproteobacteria bacterium]
MNLLLRRRMPGDDLTAPLPDAPALAEDRAWHLEVALARSFKRQVALHDPAGGRAEALFEAMEARGQRLQRLPPGAPRAALEEGAVPVLIGATEDDVAAVMDPAFQQAVPWVVTGSPAALRRASQHGYTVWEVRDAPPAPTPWRGDAAALREALAEGPLDGTGSLGASLLRAPKAEAVALLQDLLTEPGPVGDRAAQVLAEIPLALMDKAALLDLAKREDPTLAGRALGPLLGHRTKELGYTAWRLLRGEADAPRRAAVRFLCVDNDYPAEEQLFKGPEAHRALAADWLRRVPKPYFPVDRLRAWAGGLTTPQAEAVLRVAEVLFGPVGREAVISALVDAVHAQGQTELVLLDRNIEGTAAVIDPELLWAMMLGEPDETDAALLTEHLLLYCDDEDDEDDEDPLDAHLSMYNYDSVAELVAGIPGFAAQVLGRAFRRGRAPEVLARVEEMERRGAHKDLTEEVRLGMELLE